MRIYGEPMMQLSLKPDKTCRYVLHVYTQPLRQRAVARVWLALDRAVYATRLWKLLDRRWKRKNTDWFYSPSLPPSARFDMRVYDAVHRNTHSLGMVDIDEATYKGAK